MTEDAKRLEEALNRIASAEEKQKELEAALSESKEEARTAKASLAEFELKVKTMEDEKQGTLDELGISQAKIAALEIDCTKRIEELSAAFFKSFLASEEVLQKTIQAEREKEKEKEKEKDDANALSELDEAWRGKLEASNERIAALEVDHGRRIEELSAAFFKSFLANEEVLQKTIFQAEEKEKEKEKDDANALSELDEAWREKVNTLECNFFLHVGLEEISRSKLFAEEERLKKETEHEKDMMLIELERKWLFLLALKERERFVVEDRLIDREKVLNAEVGELKRVIDGLEESFFSQFVVSNSDYHARIDTLNTLYCTTLAATTSDMWERLETLEYMSMMHFAHHTRVENDLEEKLSLAVAEVDDYRLRVRSLEESFFSQFVIGISDFFNRLEEINRSFYLQFVASNDDLHSRLLGIRDNYYTSFALTTNDYRDRMEALEMMSATLLVRHVSVEDELRGVIKQDKERIRILESELDSQVQRGNALSSKMRRVSVVVNDWKSKIRNAGRELVKAQNERGRYSKVEPIGGDSMFSVAMGGNRNAAKMGY